MGLTSPGHTLQNETFKAVDYSGLTVESQGLLIISKIRKQAPLLFCLIPIHRNLNSTYRVAESWHKRLPVPADWYHKLSAMRQEQQFLI